MTAANTPKRAKIEILKEASQHLRGDLAAELTNNDPNFSDDGGLLLKFHGIYQQDDRDLRKSRKAQGLGPDYSFMIRVAIPGGILSASQYLALDDLAAELANSSLRLTTRQAIQYHGVYKNDLKTLMQTINSQLLTTLSACGDVVRNIMACPAPLVSRARSQIMHHARALSEQLKPKTQAYYELWLDGEKAASVEAATQPEQQPEHEPLYGETYLPRKFKIAFAYPGDNCVDVYTQDIGIVPVVDADGDLVAFTLIVGGGLGQSHTVKDTHPCLGQPLATVAPAQLAAVCEAIVKVQRDFGRRDDRKFSRMKYLVKAWGIARFKAQVEDYLGLPLADPQPLSWLSGDDHLGWHQQGDGKLFLGLFIENGRIKDNIRSGLRAVIEQFRPEVRLTAQQNLILAQVNPQDQAGINALLAQYGIALPDTIEPVVLQAMACPAFPTCGLAITEAERVMPAIIREFSLLLQELALNDGPVPHVRMTGCPNGCARPYSAEVGLVGQSLNSYALYLGGSPLGTRLAQEYLSNVPRQDLTNTLRPLLSQYRDQRQSGEAFGDFCSRIGFAALRDYPAASSK
jgi:sulfite reductase (ferredoxin)